MSSGRHPALLVPALVLALTAACGGSSNHGATVPVKLPSLTTLQYFGDVKTAMSPLLVHVQVLPAMLDAVSQADAATPSQVAAATRMAFDFATARDLVGRLPLPSGAPAPVGELMQLACQLYRTSASELTHLPSVPRGVVSHATIRNAVVLQQLGDRLIDQVRRLLAVDHAGTGDLDIEYRYVDPVPTVDSVTPTTVSTRSYAADSVSTALEKARHVLDAETSHASRPTASGSVLTPLATRLEQLATNSPEYVVTARIALLLGVLADETNAYGRNSASDVLLMLSNDTWNQAAALPGNRVPPLGPPRLARSSVWTGGAFNGNPPPLAPGQDVGSGVTGGLPHVDGFTVAGR